MIYIFAGPTISHIEIRQHLDCVCLPPVCHGDILRVLESKPTAIGIIDGYFEGAPAVWHKEILYALDQGVHVFGSSSMGALRAAELHPFGMNGVGQIYQWYKDDLIDADDEVAVLHGPAEVDYLAVSVPLVNVRATLSLAEQQGKISSEQNLNLIQIAQSIYYKKRSWAVFLGMCADEIGSSWQTNNLKAWFDLNRIDLKKQDALELLETMNQHIASKALPFTSDFFFENTNVWSSAVTRHERLSKEAQLLSGNQEKVLNQLRLDPERYERYRDKALITWLSDNPIEIHKQDINLKNALKVFRVDNQLGSHSQLMDCLQQMELNEAQLTQLLDGACRVELVRLAAGNLQSAIIKELKLDGTFLQLLDSDRNKQEKVNNARIESSATHALPPQILAWYFRTKLGVSLPSNLDCHLKRVDLKNSEEFYRLITAEYLYCFKVDSDN